MVRAVMSRRCWSVAAFALVALVIAGVVWLWPTKTLPSTTTTETATATTTTPDDATRLPRVKARSRVLLGEVTDAGGVGIAGAVVSVVTGEREVARAIADRDGRFSLEPFPEVVTSLTFSAEGWLPATVEGSAVPALVEAFWSQVLAPDPARRTITVRAGDELVANARIFLVEPLPARAAEAVAVSDEQGRAFVGRDVAGALMAAHPAHGAAFVRDDVATLPAGGSLQVVIVDEDRRPVAGARVLVRATGQVAATDPLAVATRVAQGRTDEAASDEQGVVLWPAAEGDVVVDVVAAGHRPARREERVRAGRVTVVEVRLDESPTVVGVVIDAASGEPVPGATVSSDAGGRLTASATTDAEGRFELAGFDARPSSLTVRQRGYSTLTVGSIDGAASRLDPLRLELTKGRGDQVVGIGVTVGLQEGKVLVRSVEAGSPAEEAGLLAGDVIAVVDGVTLGTDLADVTGRIRGQPGTRVRLGVVGQTGARRDVEIERQVIAVQARGRRR